MTPTRMPTTHAQEETHAVMPRLRTQIVRLVLLVLGTTALGGLAGGALIAVARTSYQADAYVALAPMPDDVRTALGPTQAHSIDAVYRAGPLGSDVLERAARQMIGRTPAEVRAQVRVNAVSFTPLIQITAHADQPGEAQAIANIVASTWVARLIDAYDSAFTTLETGLTASDDTLSDEIATTQQAIVTGTAQCGHRLPRGVVATCASPAQVAAWQATISVDVQQQTAVRDAITLLAVRRAQVIRIAYLAIPADDDTTMSLPDVRRILEAGLGGGFTLGVLLALWLLRGPIRQTLRQRMRRGAESGAAWPVEVNQP